MTLKTHLLSLKKYFLFCALTGLLAVLVTACGKPFNVKPKPAVKDTVVQAQPEKPTQAESKGVRLQAEAIKDEDFLYDTFEANMIMAGVLPVRVKLTNTGSDAAELKKAKFAIKSQNKIYKFLDSHKAYKCLMSYYGISIYNKNGFKESRADFDTHAIDVKKPLDKGETREGLLYFAVPSEVVRRNDLTLSVRKLSAGRSKDDAAVELILK
jgi:hypothetical protein